MAGAAVVEPDESGGTARVQEGDAVEIEQELSVDVVELVELVGGVDVISPKILKAPGAHSTISTGCDHGSNASLSNDRAWAVVRQRWRTKVVRQLRSQVAVGAGPPGSGRPQGLGKPQPNHRPVHPSLPSAPTEATFALSPASSAPGGVPPPRNSYGYSSSPRLASDEPDSASTEQLLPATAPVPPPFRPQAALALGARPSMVRLGACTPERRPRARHRYPHVGMGRVGGSSSSAGVRGTSRGRR